MNFIRLTILSIILFFSLPIVYAQEKEPVTAIIGAVDKEVVLLQNNMTDRKVQKIQGLTFIIGRLKGRKVVLAKTGVGKVNAAMAVTILLITFKPTEVIFTGIAGSLNPALKLGDIVMATQTVQYDFGTLMPEGLHNWGMKNPIDDKTNPVFYLADTVLLNAAQKAANVLVLTKIRIGRKVRNPVITKGTVVTGDMFVASTAKSKELREKYNADAVEMEGGAVAQVCWQYGIPCLVIRSLSDAADENAKKNYDTFINIAATNSANLVMGLIENLQNRNK
jgi:adenosylhomocysteine nucleosidase